MFPPQMSEEEYKKLTKTQKKIHWIFTIIVFTIIISSWAYVLFWK